MKQVKTIQPRQLAQQGKCLIIDVRTPLEYAEKHLKVPHKHIPLDQFDAADIAKRFGKSGAVVLLCRSGGRAARAAQALLEAGCSNVTVVQGGLEGCESCGEALEGFGVAGGKPANAPVSLERQVRIAAGAMVMLGALAALVFNPLFALVPLAVGGGLVFAGVTNRCGLALVLTRAPWNRLPSNQ